MFTPRPLRPPPPPAPPPQLEYDRQFATLRRRKKYPLDGAPFVAGLVSILKQFHHSYTRQFLAFLGQYVRSMVDDSFTKDNKIQELPVEALNVLLIMEMFLRFAHLPRSCVEGYGPSYIFDAISLS